MRYYLENSRGAGVELIQRERLDANSHLSWRRSTWLIFETRERDKVHVHPFAGCYYFSH